MDLLPTEEQLEIVNTVSAQLAADFSLNDLAANDETDDVIDAALWQRCAELGWFALGISEANGGVGYTLVEEALLFEELGAHATPGPFLATVLAGHVAADSGASDVLERVLSGTSQLALAEPEDVDAVVSAESVRGTFRITDHGGAELALALSGEVAAIIDLTGVATSPEASLDPLVPLATATLDAKPLACMSGPSVRRRATVLVAAELAGIARATAEQSTEYAKDRQQFGVPVGSFQAVKHRCADMAVRADAAVNLTHMAALAVVDDRPDADFQAEAARVLAADAALENSQINVQNHGGIGFTWEHTAHRYVTRAQFRARTAGTREQHLTALLEAPAGA
jgi:alkylation response protein AidB-like acyl-CoA dehydrogenase